MFDGKTFLKANFREPGRVRPMFASYGLAAPSEAAVVKWFQRGTIPSDWFPMLLCLVELETGKPVSVVQFLRKR